MGDLGPFGLVSPPWGLVAHALLERPPLAGFSRLVRLACTRHAASVRPGPGSSPQGMPLRGAAPSHHCSAVKVRAGRFRDRCMLCQAQIPCHRLRPPSFEEPVADPAAGITPGPRTARARPGSLGQGSWTGQQCCTGVKLQLHLPTLLANTVTGSRNRWHARCSAVLCHRPGRRPFAPGLMAKGRKLTRCRNADGRTGYGREDSHRDSGGA